MVQLWSHRDMVFIIIYMALKCMYPGILNGSLMHFQKYHDTFIIHVQKHGNTVVLCPTTLNNVLSHALSHLRNSNALHECHGIIILL